MNTIKTEDSPAYLSNNTESQDDLVIQHALKILESRMVTKGFSATSPSATIDYLALTIGLLEHEEFHLLLLDTQHRLIKHVSLFRGTIDCASVYPREILKEVLACNAAAVILAHNHPSGFAEPSNSDKQITEKIKQSLNLIDVRTLDHIIIGGVNHYSFAEHRMI